MKSSGQAIVSFCRRDSSRDSSRDSPRDSPRLISFIKLLVMCPFSCLMWWDFGWPNIPLKFVVVDALHDLKGCDPFGHFACFDVVASPCYTGMSLDGKRCELHQNVVHADTCARVAKFLQFLCNFPQNENRIDFCAPISAFNLLLIYEFVRVDDFND